jgi:hypothetical protein
VPYVNKGGVQARHKAFDAPKEDVPYGKIVVRFLVMQLHKFGVFQQRNFNFRGGGIDNEFFFHGIFF